MLALCVELDAVAAADSWDAPVEGVGETLHKQRLLPWEHVRDLEAKQLLSFFGAEVHHTAGKKRQADGCDGPGHMEAYKHVIIAEAF